MDIDVREIRAWLSACERQTLVAFGVVYLLVSVPAAANTGSAESHAYYERALSQAENDNLRAAVIELKNALQLDPQNGDARLLLGEIYLRLNDGAAAEKELRAAGRRGISKERIVIALGRALLLQGRYEALLNEIDPETYGQGVALDLALQ